MTTKPPTDSLNQKCAYCGHALYWHDPYGCNHFKDDFACYCEKFMVSVETAKKLKKGFSKCH